MVGSMSKESKGLEILQKDFAKIGGLKCFKLFEMNYRSREELIIRIRVPGEVKSRVESKRIQKSDASKLVSQYLIGAYSRYSRPHVWKCSGQTRKAEGDPIELTSSTNWNTGATKIWDILQDIIEMHFSTTTTSIPRGNAFAIDFEELRQLHVEERMLTAGALAGFLRCLLECGKGGDPVHLVDELSQLITMHCSDMARLLRAHH